VSTEILLQSDYVTVTFDRALGLVRYDRTAAPFASVAEYDASLDHVIFALLPVERAHASILVDIRRGPIRSGEDFDPSALRFRRKMFHGFARTAVLVATDTGQLQIKRHEKEAKGGPTVFRDEAEALRFLRGE
jgi:hypothetical protein